MRATFTSFTLLLTVGSLLLLVPYTPLLATNVAVQFNNSKTNLAKAV
jgi:hypothetical protein